MFQFGYPVLQGIQLLLHLLPLLLAAVTEGHAFLLQRQHLGQQLPLQLVHLGVQGGGHHRRRGWGGREVHPGWELLLLMDRERDL